MTPKVLFLFLIFTVIGVRAWNVRITPHEDELIRPTGKNVYVVCQVELEEGGPEERPSIRWLKNGKEVNAFNVRPTRKLPLTNKYHKTLFLNNPTLNDGGKFTCEARIAGETQQQEVEISFKEAAKFDPTTEREQHPDEGAEEARVYCKVEGYDIEVDWLFNGTAVEETHRNYEFENDGQTLVIPKFDSAKDNGIYTCRWQQFNTFGALNISVIAHEKPKIGMFPFAGNNTAFEGQSAQFQCQAAGKPKPTIRWFYLYQNGTEVELLPSDKHNSTNGVLKIRKVSMTDAGTYKCLARNDKGEDVRTVDIRVIAKPKIDSMGELIRQEGEEITFQCIFRGEGTLRAQWVRDGTILETAEFVPSDDNRHIFNYTIGRVSAEEHMGNYTCEVSNEAGVNSRNALLKVHHAPKIISNNGTYDFVAEQSDVDLVCGASAVPIPEWTWLFNGSPLSSSIITIDNFEDGTSKLHIENFPENQYGKYTCVARNQHGDDSHTVELIRQESPEIPSLECIEAPDADAIHCIDKNENGQDAHAKSPEQYVVYYAEKKDVEGEGSHEVELDDDADEDGHHVSLEQDAENKLLDQGYTLQTLPYAGGHIWIRDLKPGTKYILQVAAKNGAGESNLTDAIEVETPSESAGFELPSGVGIPILIVLLLLVCGIDLLCCICRSKGLTAAICRRCCKRASEKHILEDKREQNPMLLEEDVSIERNIIKGSFRGPASSKV